MSQQGSTVIWDLSMVSTAVLSPPTGTLCSRNVHSAFNQSISQPSEAIFETMETKMTGVQRSATWNPTSARVCSVLREEQIRRTPVMGIKAEARRLSYIKNRQIRRNQSTLSRRSIHRGKKTWFRRKPQPQMRNSMDENNLQRQHQSTAQWARTVINRLSFNKLFKK